MSRAWDWTEGWAAGLQLAAASLRGRDDRSAFIATFAGDDRHVVDYLAYEVLDGLPAARRRFLMGTSILDRLSGELCDAVLETHDAAAVLHDLERENLFVVALDDKRRWYRYHHLFGDLLRGELARAEPDRIGELHRRAAAWHRDEGHVDAAIGHALRAGASRASVPVELELRIPERLPPPVEAAAY